jgi:redox-sensitive bicupin YhaK (pirin superfamily)
MSSRQPLGFRNLQPLGFQWPAMDPFLFCVHHEDHYPAGNEKLGPAASLAGRDLGQDFAGKDGWNMYHGGVVPGFPQHPHRGFETVTIVRRGLIDHSDSLGATARFGGGDVQWLTAGRGIVHSEMFPLVHPDRENPLELFQIWLNLPRSDKMVAPYFTMLWNERIPVVRNGAEVHLIAGRLGEVSPLAPPPNSWAARSESDLTIWTIKLAPGARWTMPARSARGRLYYFAGNQLNLDGERLPPRHSVDLDGAPVALENGDVESELLLLGGKPIGEPIAQYGPFVMNTRAEIQQAFVDYQRTRFGGWPFGADDPVHPREQQRFARHADGHIEHPPC